MDTIQNTTLPNQARLLNDIVGDLNGLVKEVGGLEKVCTTPDLLPIPNSQGDFCQLDTQGNLLVRVYNQGGGNAGASTTSLFFHVPDGSVFDPPPPYFSCGASGGCLGVHLPTDPLVGFGGQNFTVPIPLGCYGTGIDGKCEFKIAVDDNNMVLESNEANNNAGGGCFGQIS